MNIIFVNDDLRDADFFGRELKRFIPEIRVDISPNTRDALVHLAKPGRYDVILLGTSVSSAEAVYLTTTVRNEKIPVGIVAMLGTNEMNAPEELSGAGVDGFVHKRADFVPSLAEALLQAKERHHKALAPSTSAQVQLLFAGDFDQMQSRLSGLPKWKLEPAVFSKDGCLQLPDAATFPLGVVIIDLALSGIQTLNAIKEAHQRRPDIPIILLTNPGDEVTPVNAMKMGATDCIAKTGNYFNRLVPVIEREVQRLDLIREKALIKSREERLRQIVESMPVGITVIAADGTFLAANLAALKLMGGTHLEQVVGKSLVELAPEEESKRIRDFLKTICGGASGSLRLDWKGLDGTVPGIEMRGVSIRRDNNGTTAALTVIQHVENREAEDNGKQDQAKGKGLIKTLLEADAGYKDPREQGNIPQIRPEMEMEPPESTAVPLDAALREAEAKLAQLEEKHGSERADWEQELGDLEQRLREAEKRRMDAQNTLQESEARLAQLAGERNSERSNWELLRAELDQKRKDAEDQMESLQNALTEKEERIARLNGELEAASGGWDQARVNLEEGRKAVEEQRDALQSALGDKEAEIARLAGELETERAGLETARAESEQKHKESQDRNAALENALREAEERIAELNGELEAARGGWDQARVDLEEGRKAVEEQRDALQAALGNKEALISRLAEERNAERGDWDRARSELEERLRQTEGQREILQNSLREAEEHISWITDELGAARNGWDQARADLEQGRKAVEEQRDALQSALGNKEAEIARLAEELITERAGLETARAESEQKHKESEDRKAVLENALREAEQRIAQLNAELDAARGSWDQVRVDLEQGRKAVEEERDVLQAALREKEAQIARFVEEQNAERYRWELVRTELDHRQKDTEEQKTALQTALQAAESRIARLTDDFGLAHSGWDQARADLEGQLRAAEEQRMGVQNALADAESRFTRLSEERSDERAQWDRARDELLKERAAAGEQSEILRAELRTAQDRIAQIIGEREAERAAWESARIELEKGQKAAADQRTALQAALQDVEVRLARLADEYGAERSGWDNVRSELENGIEKAREKKAALEAALQEGEKRITELISENRDTLEQLEDTRRGLKQLSTEFDLMKSRSEALSAHYQRMSRMASMGIVVAAPDGRVLSCNDAAARLFGYAGADEALAAEEEHPFAIYAFEGALSERLRKEGKLENVEWSTLRKDGRLIRIQENAVLVEAAAGESPQVERVLTDISQIYDRSEDIRRAHRMESTRNLASETIKSLMDLCASLSGRSELLREAPAVSPSLQQLAEALSNDANRGIRHARQFLSFVQKADRERELADVNKIMVEAETMLRSLVGVDIDFHLVLSPRPGLIWTDRQEMIQLLCRLVSSSREILPLGGTITAETSNIEIGTPEPSAGMCPGAYTLVTVSAEGCNVHPERRIASIKKMAESAGGYLATEHHPQAGNIFKIYMPRVVSLVYASDSASGSAM